MKKILVFLIVFLSNYAAISQSFFQRFWKTLNINTSEIKGKVFQAYDNGDIIMGTTVGDTGIGYKMMIIKTDSIGDYKWAKGYGGVYGANYICNLTSLTKTHDGHVVFGGSASFDSVWSFPLSVYLIKIDTSGSVIWKHSYKSLLINVLNKIVACSNGDLLVSGYLNDTISGHSAYNFLMRLDSMGNIKWAKRNIFPFNSTTGTNFLSKGLLEVESNKFLLYNSLLDTITNKLDLVVNLYDSLGGILLSKKIATPFNDLSGDVIKTPDNNFVFTAMVIYDTLNNSRSAVFFKTDSLFNLIWFKKMSFQGLVNTDLSNLNDGNYLWSNAYGITKIDTSGNLVWEATYAISGLDIRSINMARQVNDNIIVIGEQLNLSTLHLGKVDTTGLSPCITYWYNGQPVIDDTVSITSNIPQENYFLFTDSVLGYSFPIVLTPDPICVSAVSIQEGVPQFNLLHVYPTITSNYITIENLNLNEYSFKIIDPLAKEFISEKNSFDMLKKINIETLSNGFYLLNIETRETTRSFKIIKQ